MTVRAPISPLKFAFLFEIFEKYGLGKDPLIHREVVSAISGLREFLEIERKRVPGEVLYEADRLGCLFFAGYDPHFEGDEAARPLA